MQLDIGSGKVDPCRLIGSGGQTDPSRHINSGGQVNTSRLGTDGQSRLVTLAAKSTCTGSSTQVDSRHRLQQPGQPVQTCWLRQPSQPV